MVICVFGNTIVKPGKVEAEATWSAQLEPVLRAMPGFIRVSR